MIKFLDNTGLAYFWEKIKSFVPSLSKKSQSIPFGQVDSTSTSTAFTATIDGITELRDGVCCYLRNGVVTSASGFTININNLGAKPAYNTMATETALTTQFNKTYTMLFIYNSTRVSGGCWDMYYGYDSNTTYNLTTNYTSIGRINVGEYPLSTYSLCAFDVNDKLTPFVTTATNDTGKTLVPSVFPVGAKVYASDYSLEANSTQNNLGAILTTVTTFDLRYSSVNHNIAIFPNNTFNRIFMPVIVDVSNNTFTLTTQTTSGYNNNFTNERSLISGKFYIDIGFNSNSSTSYYFTLIQDNRLYYYNGTKLIDYYVYKSDLVLSDLSSKADKVSNSVSGNFAGLDSNGNLTNSGHKHGDYVTSLGTSGNNLAWQKNGVTNNLTVPYATKAEKDGNGNVITSRYIPYGAVLQPTNPFGGKGVYINSIDNAFHAANRKYWVRITTHLKEINGVTYPYIDSSKEITDDGYFVDSPVVSTLNNSSLFNGDYEDGPQCPFNHYMKVHIQFAPFTNDWTPSGTTAYWGGYPYGTYYLSYYYTGVPSQASQARIYNKYSEHTVGWHLKTATTFTGTLGNANYIEQIVDESDYRRSCVEFIIFGLDSGSYATKLTEIDYKLSRPNLSSNGSTVTKYGNQSLYYDFKWFKHNDDSLAEETVSISAPDGYITAEKFIKSGGTSSQFLKADGSVDSNTYLTQHQTLPNYTIEKLGTAETGYASSYVLKKDNVQVGDTINIPKDMVVSNGEVKTVSTANTPYQGAVVGDKYIDLTIANASSNHIYIPVKDLVDVYTSGNGIDISNSNVVSVKIDSSNANGLATTSSGLKLTTVVASTNGSGGSSGAMTAAQAEKLAGIATGAEVNVQSDWNQTNTSADDYIKNKPTNVSEFTNDADYISEEDALSKILIPNFDNITPIKTIELDVASTSYYQLFSRTNTGISNLMTEVDDTVMFRITTTGTNIYAVTDFFVKYRSGLVYPFVAGYNDTYGVSAATTGLYYVRFQYPKTLNSGYAWLCDFRTYNTTARHIKVEVFATTENITWVDSLTATTYNSTYQTDNGGVYPYDKRGCFYNGTLYAAVTSASTANYITSFHVKYVNSDIIKAGEALVSSYMLYVSNDYAFRISNKNNPIDVDFGIGLVGTSYSANSYIAYNQFRPQGALTFTTDTNLTYDPIAKGDKVYLRCRLVGDKIYSDGHLSTKMTAGYTWYMLGGAYNTTQVSMNTLGSFFITLDENGMISHINGKPTQAALMNGSYERSFCGEIESDVSANAKLRSIEGRSIVFNQITQNGDFSNSTTGWAATQSATLSVSDGVLSAYRSNGQAYFGAVTTGNNGKVYKDHKYFYSIYAKASKAMNAYTPYFDSTYVTLQQAVAIPFQLTTEWKRFVGIVISVKDGQCLFGIRNHSSNVGEATIYMKNAMMIDLTKMFGAGNEPQDTEMLKEMFPLDYYDYNLDGTLLGGVQTGFKSEDSEGTTLTNLSIPITTLTGAPSGGTSEVMFPYGLLGIGDIRDEIDFENGTAVKRIGVVDLGTKSWTYHSDYNAFRTLDVTDAKPCSGIVPLYQMNSNAYESIITMSASAANKTLSLNSSSHTANSLWIKDTSYSDATTFTTAMDGVYLYYALATPIEYTIDTVPTVEYDTERGGSEQWLPVNTSTPTVAPICCISGYGSNVLVDLDKKADKVVGAVSGNFAGLDETGNLTDSGSKASDFATSTHTHGNITNGGSLQTNDITIASGDKLVVTDSSDSGKISRTSLAFDGTTTNTALTPKGTFERFLQSADLNTYWANQQLTSSATYNTEPEFKTVTINGSTNASTASTENGVLLYDTEEKCIKFMFN